MTKALLMITSKMNRTKMTPTDVKAPKPTPQVKDMIDRPPSVDWIEVCAKLGLKNQGPTDDDEQNEQDQNDADRRKTAETCT